MKKRRKEEKKEKKRKGKGKGKRKRRKEKAMRIRLPQYKPRDVSRKWRHLVSHSIDWVNRAVQLRDKGTEEIAHMVCLSHGKLRLAGPNSQLWKLFNC